MSTPSFGESLRRFNSESGGCIQLEIIRQQDVFPITVAAMGGSREAMARLSAIRDSVGMIKALARKKPAVCLCCPRSIRDPHAVLAVLVPASDVPTTCIASAICERCSTGLLEAVLSRAAIACTKVWPSLRCVEITHPEGGQV